MSLEYEKRLIPCAKKLRQEMTPWERKLWYGFLKDYPIRFQRQKTIGRYIVDFYAHQVKLVVELDGGQHYEETQRGRDAERDSFFMGQGIEVLRFSNLDVASSFEAVCRRIDTSVRERV